MKKKIHLPHLFVALLIVFSIAACQKSTAPKKYVYPVTVKQEVVDNYHGTLVKDPYRWLEDSKSPEVKAWIEEQNKITFSYLSTVAQKEEINKRLTELYNYQRYRIMEKKKERYFFYKNDGLQNQYVFYMQEGLEALPSVVIDPNALSEDGTIAVTNIEINDDGTLMVYALSYSGSDNQELRIRNIDTGKDYDEVLKWCKFSSISWKKDNEGFFYNRFPETGTVPEEDENNYNRVYWHSLGTMQSEDKLIFEQPEEKELIFQPAVTEDEQYIILEVLHGTDPTNRIYYQELHKEGDFIKLLNDADAQYSFLGNDGSIFYFNTDLDAPRGRIISIDTSHPARENWAEIIPEAEETLDYAAMINNKFVLRYMQDASNKLKIYNPDGSFIKNIDLPTLGDVSYITGKRKDDLMFFYFTSFLYPGTIFQYDFVKDTLTAVKESRINFDTSTYETKQIFYQSKDGTKVPMFIVQRKGITLDGNNPALLYGYGGFNVEMTPYFSIFRLVWLELGGIWAMPNLRGGSEYGEEWHKAGMLENKQNVFDDFIAAAEWLINNKYTNASRLAIEGASNGGLLVAATMLQRPELFGAVLCEVPVTDMFRYHKFTIGRYWVGEYGNAEENPEHFKFLSAYSPLHNVKPGVNYSPIFITTADTDDRVVPTHSMKFAATLQAASPGNKPVLIRIETKAGHGRGKPLAKIIEESTDQLAFLIKVFSL